MKQLVSETGPKPGMTPEEWDLVRTTYTAARLKAEGFTVETMVDVPDPDPDSVLVQQIRDKSLKGTLTDAEIKQHNEAEIRLKAKGLL